MASNLPKGADIATQGSPVETKVGTPADVAKDTRGEAGNVLAGAEQKPDWTELIEHIEKRHANGHGISDDLYKKIGDLRGLSYEEVAKRLIDADAAFLLSPKDFPDQNRLAHMLITSENTHELSRDLHLYRGPLDADIAFSIVDEDRLGVYSIFRNLDKFPGLDHEKFVDRVIAQPGEMSSTHSPHLLDGFSKELQDKLRKRYPKLGN